MNETVQQLQRDVRQGLDRFFASETVQETLSDEPWGPRVREILAEYVRQGKLIRGALVGLGSLLYRGSYGPEAVEVGVAMELLQSFLLIHDDIMDQDEQRRGQPAMHARVRRFGVDPQRAEHYGVSIGICVGDVAAFLAQMHLGMIACPPGQKAALITLVGREIVRVGIAQMQDVHHGYQTEAEPEAIRAVYTYKTGRYTFSLPLIAGAILAGQEEGNLSRLGQIGEALGRIFQIRDDSLGIFGDERQTGKPVGSDIRENKKTLLRHYLLRQSPHRERLQRIFGAAVVSPEDLSFVRAEAVACGAVGRLDAEIAADEAFVATAVAEERWHPTGRSAFDSLVAYNRARSV